MNNFTSFEISDLAAIPGLEPTRSHRLLALRGSVGAILPATPTELEARSVPLYRRTRWGLAPVDEAANDEFAKASAAGDENSRA
jgi:hypothetical protein